MAIIDNKRPALFSRSCFKQETSNELLLVLTTQLGEYRRQPLLNLGFILSLAIATSTLLSILMLNHASKQQYSQASATLNNPVAFYIQPKQGKKLQKTDFVRLRRSGFHQLNPVLTFRKTLANGKFLNFKAIDLLPLTLINPQHYDSEKVHISQVTLERLELNLAGERTLVLADDSQISIKENNSAAWGQLALLDIVLAWQLFPELSGFSYLTVNKLTDTEQTRLINILPNHLILQPAWSLEQRSGFADALHLNLTALAILGFLISLFIAFQSGEQAWCKRSELAAQLRLLGCTLTVIRKSLLIEALILIVIASILGTGLAIILVSLLLPLLGITLTQLYQLNINGQFGWHWQYAYWSLLISAFAIITTLSKQFSKISTGKIALLSRQKHAFDSGSPATKQTRTSTIRARLKQYINDHTALVTALVLLFLFVITPELIPKSQTAIFAEHGVQSWHIIMLRYGLLLLATVAILPDCLKVLLGILAKLVKTFTLKFMLQDARIQVKKRSLPLAAFYIALTTSIAAALMINSFESAFTQYLDQHLNQDLYIRVNAEQKQPLALWLASQSLIDEYSLYHRGFAKLGLDTVSLGIYSSNKQLHSLVFKEQATEQAKEQNKKPNKDPLKDQTKQQQPACFINEPLALKRDLELGEHVIITQEHKQINCRVQGIYFDYGNPKFELYLSLSLAQTHDFSLIEKGYGIFLKDKNNQQVINNISQTLIETFQLNPEQIIKPEQVKTMALTIFKQTFIITRSITLVLMCIACFGLFLSVNTLELARKSQLFILKSLGYSRRALLRHMLMQWLLLAMACIILSFPLAIMLANALVTEILPASFGWSMPLLLTADIFVFTSLTGLLCLLPALLIPLHQLKLHSQ